MARPKKAVMVQGVNIVSLAALVAATQDQAKGSLFLTTAESDPFVNFTPEGATAPTPLAERNPAITDPNDANKIATRATPAGVQFAAANPAPQRKTPAQKDPNAPPEVRPTFEMEMFIGDIPQGKRGSIEKIYPFDTMTAPDLTDPAQPKRAAFFVKPTAKMPEPWRSLNSTVSSANRRYAKAQLDANGQPVKNSAGEVQKVYERRYVVKPETRWFDAAGQRVQPNTAGATEVKGAIVIREK